MRSRKTGEVARNWHAVAVTAEDRGYSRVNNRIDESQLEGVTVDYLCELGYEHIHGPVIAPDGEAPERQDYGQVVLTHRLRDALVRINPDVPDQAIEDALRQVTRTDSPSLIVNNRAFHRMLTDGVDVSWRDDGREQIGRASCRERGCM